MVYTPLNRLPQTPTDPAGLIEDTFLQSHEEKRKQWTDDTGKKVGVKPLKYQLERVYHQTTYQNNETAPSTSSVKRKKSAKENGNGGKRGKGKKRERNM